MLLAIIGPGWLTATDERSRQRPDDPDDIVRLEIEAALPAAYESFRSWSRARSCRAGKTAGEPRWACPRHALPIRHESFRYDAGRLVAAIERVLEALGTAAISAAPDATPPARNAVHVVAQQE